MTAGAILEGVEHPLDDRRPFATGAESSDDLTGTTIDSDVDRSSVSHSTRRGAQLPAVVDGVPQSCHLMPRSASARRPCGRSPAAAAPSGELCAVSGRHDGRSPRPSSSTSHHQLARGRPRRSPKWPPARPARRQVDAARQRAALVPLHARQVRARRHLRRRDALLLTADARSITTHASGSAGRARLARVSSLRAAAARQLARSRHAQHVAADAPVRRRDWRATRQR